MNWRINLLFLLLAVHLFACRTAPIQEEKKDATYASTACLIEADTLWQKLSSENGIKLIDLRKSSEYATGHIHGAFNIWRDQITDTSYAYGGMMPTRTHVEQLLGRHGISPSDTIVIYDRNAACDAARLWWILRFYGHQHIKLLNGGLNAWESEGHHLSTEYPQPEPGEYRFLSAADSTIHASYPMVKANINNPDIILIDTRGSEEFNGKLKDGAARGGHIEGAINLDWSTAVDYAGTHRFLDADQLKVNFLAVGIREQTPVITYCHSGVRSAHTYFVLSELLGYRNIRNYDGSWIEWSHVQAK